jgi:hypothetical protein
VSGDLYDGFWFNDQKNGKGHYTWSDGKTYIGEYLGIILKKKKFES